MSPSPRSRDRIALLLVAFASGGAALLYQTLWLRGFRLLFGSTAYAASATLCAFFLGLALGAALFGWLSTRTTRPLSLYAAIELAGAVLALAVPAVTRAYDPLYAALYDSLADTPALFLAVKFGLALAVMLPPTLLLGGTLPLLAAAYVGDRGDLGRDGSLLYAVNTLGAALGAALGALVLPERLGMRGSFALALCVAALAAGGAFALRRRLAGAAPSPQRVRTAEPRLLAVAFTSGLSILAFEVLLVHAIAQVIASTVYSFGAVLLVVLLALAAASLGVAFASRRLGPERLLLGALLASVLLLATLPALTVWATDGLRLWMTGTLRNGLLLALALGAPTLLAGGMVLPLTFRLAEGGAVGARVGGLLAANTAGGGIGAAAASFLLLDHVGLWPSFGLLAAGYAALALRVAPSRRARLATGVAFVLLAATLLSTATHPFRLPVLAIRDGERVLAVRESAQGVAAVVDAGGERLLKVDNHYALAGSGAVKTEERAGHLPLLLHPSPRRVLFLGAASGNTAAAAVVHPVESIELVEIVPAVLELAAAHFGETTRFVHRDPRTRLIAEDARNHLRATPQHYDVVVADLFVPWRPGVGALYRREHFEAVKRRLAPGGVFCQWLPVYQLREAELALIASTFAAVFPEAMLWRGDFFAQRPRIALVAIEGPVPRVDAIAARLRALAERGVDDRWVTRPQGFFMLYLGPLAKLGSGLLGREPDSDDRPRFEFVAGRSRVAHQRAFLLRQWPGIADRFDTPRVRDPFFPDAPGPGVAGAQALARAALAGLLRGGAFAESAWGRVRRLVPAELLEPPDPSVVEHWPRP